MFNEFLNQISNSDLRNVASHWIEARGPKLMPAWADINPKAIAKQLKYTWAYHYRREDRSFIGRLAGTFIETRVHQSFHGHTMEEMFSGSELEWIKRCCQRVVDSKALHCGSGGMATIVHPLGVGERIVMPLSTDGSNVDGVIGATVYPESVETSVMDFYEREFWLPLDVVNLKKSP